MNPYLRPLLALLVAAMAGGLLAFPAPVSAVSEADLLPVDEAYVLSAKATSRERIEFTWKIAPGYYLYRHRFGVQPVDAASKFNPLELPAGEKHTDEFFGKVETYRQSVTAVLTGAAASDVDAVTFRVKYQGCADVGVCYPPQTRTLTVALPGAAGVASPLDALTPLTGLSGSAAGNLLGGHDALPEDQAFKFEGIALSASELLVRLSPAPGYYLYRDKTSFRLVGSDGMQLGAPRFPSGKPYRDGHFGDVTVYFDMAEIALPLLRTNAKAATVSLEASFQGCLTDGICYPPMVRTVQVAVPAGVGALAEAKQSATAAPAKSSDGLLFSLLAALIGGLILNLMPCVLPVLSFKALGLAESSRSSSHARAHALWYTAGVLASFAVVGAAVLALRSAGQALGWGFQLQQPWLVGALALLMFAIGLSLSGVVQFGASLAGVGQSLTEKSGAAGDFFTGVLAVVVASPCTAPFMAGALGYAFTAPVLPAMLVFLALGLGMALPFLLIGFVPALAARLPRPGAWMETLKHWLAYPMYLTAVWLVWVFGKQLGVDAIALLLVAAVLLALALWWLERQRYQKGLFGKFVSWLLIAAAVAMLVLAARTPAATKTTVPEAGTVPFSAEALARFRAEGRPVFVDMTADWCITCKVNEKAVLDTAEFRALLKRTGTIYMIGDWTNQDVAISAFLDEFNAPGVPLYVLYPADGGAGRKLPQILGMPMMRDALEDAAR